MDNLKFLRLEKKISQEKIAKHINVSQSNYSKYELGIIQPNFDILVKLADYFKTSTDFLLGRETQNFIDLSGLSQIQKELVETVKRLDYINCIKAEAYLSGLIESQDKLSQEEIKAGKKNVT